MGDFDIPTRPFLTGSGRLTPHWEEINKGSLNKGMNDVKGNTGKGEAVLACSRGPRDGQVCAVASAEGQLMGETTVAP